MKKYTEQEIKRKAVMYQLLQSKELKDRIVYHLLLEGGEITASHLCRSTRVIKTQLTMALHGMIEKGVISAEKMPPVLPDGTILIGRWPLVYKLLQFPSGWE